MLQRIRNYEQKVADERKALLVGSGGGGGSAARAGGAQVSEVSTSGDRHQRSRTMFN